MDVSSKDPHKVELLRNQTIDVSKFSANANANANLHLSSPPVDRRFLAELSTKVDSIPKTSDNFMSSSLPSPSFFSGALDLSDENQSSEGQSESRDAGDALPSKPQRKPRPVKPSASRPLKPYAPPSPHLSSSSLPHLGVIPSPQSSQSSQAPSQSTPQLVAPPTP